MSEPRHAAAEEDPHHDATDVAAALEQENDAGEGGAAPKEDFVSYEDPSADKPEDDS